MDIHLYEWIDGYMFTQIIPREGVFAVNFVAKVGEIVVLADLRGWRSCTQGRRSEMAFERGTNKEEY